MLLEKRNNTVKKIYFMFFCYSFGGGETFVFRIIEYLVKYTDIKIGIIDFNDGILSRTCKKYFPEQDFDYVEYRSSTWPLDDDSVIFTSADRLGCVKPHSGKNVKISLIMWENGICWETLFEKSIIPSVADLLKKTNAFCFMDYGCYTSGCKQLNRRFEKNYLPIFYQPVCCQHYKKQTAPDEINLVWLGRLSEAKESSIYNIVENFYKYPTSKKRIFHIVGNGTQQQAIKKEIEKYSDKIKFVFTGVLVNEELFEYLQKNTDIGVAMGTAALNFASLGIPVIAAHEHPRRFFTNEFCWLFNLYEYCTGSPVVRDKVSLPMFEKVTTFDKMLDDVCVHNKGCEIGERCRQYFIATHGSLENTAQSFLHCINRTSLTCEMLKKTVKFMPYDDIGGIAVHTVCFLGIPFFKIIHHGGQMRFYLFGFKFMKIKRYIDRTKVYFLGVKIFYDHWWGRYSFPSITSATIKEECKDKYAVNERLFKEEDDLNE